MDILINSLIGVICLMINIGVEVEEYKLLLLKLCVVIILWIGFNNCVFFNKLL